MIVAPGLCLFLGTRPTSRKVLACIASTDRPAPSGLDYTTTFRFRLRQAREDNGLTQREAAAKLGRSHSFVAKSEAGERRVDVVELLQFAAAYGKQIDFFIPNDWQTGLSVRR